MKNRIGDLNDHLFAQLERLSDENLDEKEVRREIKRTGAIVKVADRLINSANTSLRAAKIVAEHGRNVNTGHLLENKPNPDS